MAELSGSAKYSAFPRIELPGRRWPDRRIQAAPIWLSTDLRDGNQALFEPMDASKKLRMFKLLLALGFKQIECSFPSASKVEFDFTRMLIDEGHVPDDVTLQVLTPAREAMIERTMESLRGAPRAIVHVYNATSEQFRRSVFGIDRAQCASLACWASGLIRKISRSMPETDWTLQYSPEAFSATELDFSLEVCQGVMESWGATPSDRVILNLPATVEGCAPNVHADQIEWMHTRLPNRDRAILSLHPHNDRGTAVAAAELGLAAGAERVEGCLFGNGERTGNVDLATLALNMLTQGIDPGLDFSELPHAVREVEACTGMAIHPRHPYAGDLVFTAFSGSHQDAIKKGFDAQAVDGPWQVPYLAIDPADIGRGYDSIVRVNSQSGKGGACFILKSAHGIDIPRRMQIEFSRAVQARAEASGGEVGSKEIWSIFQSEHLLASQELPAGFCPLWSQCSSLPLGDPRGSFFALAEARLDGSTRSTFGAGLGAAKEIALDRAHRAAGRRLSAANPIDP